MFLRLVKIQIQMYLLKLSERMPTYLQTLLVLQLIPVFKRNSKNSKDNYRTISIFKNISKVYERRLRLTKGKSFRVLLTNLSKAFDCLPRELLIAKLHLYGFSLNAPWLILSYLPYLVCTFKLHLAKSILCVSYSPEFCFYFKQKSLSFSPRNNIPKSF